MTASKSEPIFWWTLASSGRRHAFPDDATYTVCTLMARRPGDEPSWRKPREGDVTCSVCERRVKGMGRHGWPGCGGSKHRTKGGGR
jgi:hypothetical protein